MVNKKIVVDFLQNCINQINDGRMLNIYRYCGDNYEKEEAVRYSIENNLAIVSEDRNTPNLTKIKEVTYKGHEFVKQHKDD